MWLGIERIVEHLYLNFESVILFVTMCGGLIFYGKDFRLGVVIQAVISAGLFIWFYEAGYNWTPSLIVFLITIVLLTFSLLFTAKSSYHGGTV